MPTKIAEIDLSRRTLYVKGRVRDLQIGQEIPIAKDNFRYKILPFQFMTVDGQGTETGSDGCLFDIEPNSSTRAMKTTERGYLSQRCVVEGSGWLLGTTEAGKVFWHPIDVEDESNGIIELSVGCVDCWIAGPKGLKVVDISSPPFQPNFEIEQLEENNEPSSLFWTTYNDLIHGQGPQAKA